MTLRQCPSAGFLDRSLYRSLLGQLPPRPLLAAPPSPLQARLRAAFAGPPPPRAACARAQAQQLVSYLRAQQAYLGLVARYNPGLELDDDDRVRLTARRVGLDLPAVAGKTPDRD